MEFQVHRRPPPRAPPPLKRLEAPRLLASLALAPLLAPLNALPDEEGRLAEGLALGCEALGDAAGRLAEGVPVEGRAPAVAGEGRAPVLPVEGPAPPALQPRACWLAAEAEAEGVPLLLSRLWSGCHFVPALDDDARAPVALAEVDLEVLTLAFRLTFTFLSMSMFTSLW